MLPRWVSFENTFGEFDSVLFLIVNLIFNPFSFYFVLSFIFRRIIIIIVVIVQALLVYKPNVMVLAMATKNLSQSVVRILVMVLTSVVHILHRMNRIKFQMVLVLKHTTTATATAKQQEITRFTGQFQLPMQIFVNRKMKLRVRTNAPGLQFKHVRQIPSPKLQHVLETIQQMEKKRNFLLLVQEEILILVQDIH